MEIQAAKTKKSHRAIIDPVCGMRVSQCRTNLIVTYQGSLYYFCAEACRKAFEKNPKKYLKRKGWWTRYLERLNRVTGNQPMKCH